MRFCKKITTNVFRAVTNIMFDVVKAVNVEINQNHLHVSIIKGLSNVLVGWVCTKINFLNFSVVFLSPQEFQNFKNFWIHACILLVNDR